MEERIKLYDEIISRCPDFERKGKNMLYTSANGHMFSQLNKAGEIGIRLSKEEGEKFRADHGAEDFKSYGATMRGYVHIPDHLLDNIDLLAETMQAGYRYVMSLEPK